MFYYFPIFLALIAHNVPAVYDVFLRDKGIAKQFQRQKNVLE
jgi:hypothetical protein